VFGGVVDVPRAAAPTRPEWSSLPRSTARLLGRVDVWPGGSVGFLYVYG
jgi:hypothetical protein